MTAKHDDVRGAMTMIERVARALFDELNKSIEVDGWRRDWESCGTYLRDCFREAARVAIEAMREPTTEMWSAGQREVYEGSARDAWAAMIDAALGKEGA